MGFLSVFLQAFTDNWPPPAPLIRVCQAAHEWLLPVLYHSISFTTASHLSTFVSAHYIPEGRMNSRFHLIRNIYIGGTPDEPGDLEYASTIWPLTIVCRLLWECKKLKHLTLLYLDQNEWVKMEHAIPATLKTLVLGPIHGPFRASNLPQRPQLEHFTSSQTFMRDDEVVDLVLYPSMKIFRRITDANSMGPLWAVDQVPCISRTITLEEMEIVISGPPEYSTPALSLCKRKLNEVTNDPRIRLRQDRRHWLQIIFDEFLEYRESDGT
jgi:hypothetical protein